MTAQTIMNPNPTAIRATETVASAAQLILQHHLRHLPVVDEQGIYLGTFGIFSVLSLTVPKVATLDMGLNHVPFTAHRLSDLRERLQQVAQEPVVNCLRQDVEVVYPDTPLMEAVLLLLRNRIALPVVERESRRLVGIISSWDALQKVVGEGGSE
jgi:CBS domain-containing protein